MFYVYIIKSELSAKYYVGSTGDIEERLKRHNSGRNKSTKYGLPWKVIYTEEYSDKHDAYKREMQIKAYKGGEAFKKLIH